ncbi:MAG: aldehyde dehydrogenase family protein, partial [Oscillibacter sp.]|nr:aldehyde dehydrogenase family protein [Oscillibacter sp.]
MNDIHHILSAQRAYFASGATLDVEFRIRMLKKLKAAVQAHEADIARALEEDLGKNAFEGYMCETGMVLSELTYMIRSTRRFAAKERVPTPLAQFAARSYRQPSPYGNVLIMSPWNYPFLLTLDPLVDAIAAGNTAVIKPSAYSPATSALIARLISECFPPEYVAVITGGRAENAALLDQEFDLIFFTGSQSVGKEVLRRAAEHLTPAILELGGKSPCIVDETANIPLAARRIVFGKFINCGQTCVAPDYILCAESVKEELAAALKKEILRQYGPEPLTDPSYGKIINEKHFHRLCRLVDPAKIVHGGEVDPLTCRIAPTVMENVAWEDAVMQEEIFDP